jgi:hypothetical protein
MTIEASIELKDLDFFILDVKELTILGLVLGWIEVDFLGESLGILSLFLV